TAADAGATLVGVNARDLATLEVDPDRFAAVRQALADGTVLVAESGIRDRAGVQAAAGARGDAVPARAARGAGAVLVAEGGTRDRAGVQAAAGAGADAVLVGEALVRAANPTTAVRQLLTSSAWGREIDRQG